MSRDSVSRRRALKAVVATGATASVAGCTGVLGGGKSKLEKTKETVRKAVSDYAGENGLQNALKDGYKGVFGPMVPGMGWHLSNRKVQQDALKNGLKPEKPPVLMYDSNGQLGGVEYGGPAKALSGTPDLFSEFEKVTWAPHKTSTHFLADGTEKRTSIKDYKPADLMTNKYWAEVKPTRPDVKPGDKVKAVWGRGYRGQKGKKKERVVDHNVTHPTLTSVHFWTHVENPEGAFAPVNPDFAQL